MACLNKESLECSLKKLRFHSACSGDSIKRFRAETSTELLQEDDFVAL